MDSDDLPSDIAKTVAWETDGYGPSANARVVRWRYLADEDHVEVEITTDPDYPYYLYLERDSEGLVSTHSSN